LASSANPGDRALRFISNLTHTGDFSGEPFAPRPWQAEMIRRLFGTIRPDGSRQYRKAFWALPRKQGKTELTAAIALYLMLGQGRKNQAIYSASGDVDQAALIFNAACSMIRNDPDLERLCVIYDGYKRIEFPAGDSFYRVLSSVAPNKHGLGPSAVLIDEMHVVDEELINVLTTGYGARREPLTLMITTAGWDRHSLCWDEWQYASKVRDGVIDDSVYYPVIYAAGPEDDWKDEATWSKAMPALGDFCSLEFIREEAKKAIERPRYENTFRQLYLNQWTEQSVRWLALDAWEACIGGKSLNEFAGRECFIGLDLATIYDLTAKAFWFPDDKGGGDLFLSFYAPREGVRKRERDDGVPYSAWERAGHLSLTEGKTVDYARVEAELYEDCERFEVRAVTADPWNFEAMGQRLVSAGVNVLKFPQTYRNLSEPSKRFEKLIVGRQLRHDGNQVMRWCVSNVAVETDHNENIRPSKRKSTERIDGVVAAVMAVGAAGASGEAEPASYLESEGLMVL
jgi:phage terminase large subunit-like protein